MRVKIHMEKMKGCIIPVDYHYHLYSYVYRTIGDANPKLATEIHNMDGHKPYSFSEIENPGRIIKKDNETLLKLHNNSGYFIFTSHREDIMETFVTGVLSRGLVIIKEEKFPVKEIKVLKEPEFKDRMRLKTLSPIVVSTSRAAVEKGKKEDLLPTDEEWYTFFNKNLKKKYLQFFGKEKNEELKIKIYWSKPKKYHVPGPVTAFKMEFEVQGDPELIKLGYQSGFGRRTAQGFGCVASV